MERLWNALHLRRPSVITALLLSLASPAYAQSETAQHIAIGSYMVSAGADLSVTSYGLGAGSLREANPILRPFEHKPVGMAVTKMGLGAGVSALLLKTHTKNPKAAFWTAVGLSVLNSWVTYRNTKFLPKVNRG